MNESKAADELEQLRGVVGRLRSFLAKLTAQCLQDGQISASIGPDASLQSSRLNALRRIAEAVDEYAIQVEFTPRESEWDEDLWLADKAVESERHRRLR